MKAAVLPHARHKKAHSVLDEMGFVFCITDNQIIGSRQQNLVSCSFELLHLLDQLWHDLEGITYYTIVRSLEERSLRVTVDDYDNLGLVDTREVLYST